MNLLFVLVRAFQQKIRKFFSFIIHISMYNVTKFIKSFLKWEKNFWDYKSVVNHVKFQPLFLNREKESLGSSFIGTFVDYLVRFKITKNFLKTFDVPIRGLQKYRNQIDFYNIDVKFLLETLNVIKKFENKKDFQFNLEDLTDLSKLIPYEIFFRSGYPPEFPNSLNDLTIKNIEILVNRTVDFLKGLGGEVLCGGVISMTTELISSGDWDYLVGENLIDLKIMRRSCSSQYTWLQLLTYYLLGKKSGDSRFKKIKNLVAFNPNLNDAYFLEIGRIPKYVVDYLWSQMN